MLLFALPAMAQEEDDGQFLPVFDDRVVPKTEESRVFGGIVAPEDPDIHRGSPNGLTQAKRASVRQHMGLVKNQGRRGTCSVFAATSLLESYTAINLSDQCIASMMGPDDSAFIIDRIKWALEHDLYLDADCPYHGSRERRDDLPPDLNRKYRIRAWGHGESKVFQSGDRRDPVQFVRESIDAGKPVGAGFYAMGDWWGDASPTPLELTTGRRRTVPTRNQATGEIRMMEIGETFKIDPIRAASNDQVTIDLLRKHFADQPRGRVTRVTHKPDPKQRTNTAEQEMIARDFQDYFGAIQPLDIPTKEEIDQGCSKENTKPGGTKKCHAHAVVFTGYDDASETLEFKNSWGRGWKHGGYGYMTYRYFRQFRMAQGDVDAIVAFDNRRWN